MSSCARRLRRRRASRRRRPSVTAGFTVAMYDWCRRRRRVVPSAAVVGRGLLAERGLAAATTAPGERRARARQRHADETSETAGHGGEVTGRIARLRCRAWRAARWSREARRWPGRSPEFAPIIDAVRTRRSPPRPTPPHALRRAGAGDLLPAARRRGGPHDPRSARGRARRRRRRPRRCSRSRSRRCAPPACRRTRPRRSATWPRRCSPATSSSTAWRSLSDDEIVRELTLVRGIGRWTAEMFLMFQLGRLDVWPVDDLGVRKGYGDASSSSSRAADAPRSSSRSATRCGRTARSRRGTAGAPPTLSSERADDPTRDVRRERRGLP